MTAKDLPWAHPVCTLTQALAGREHEAPLSRCKKRPQFNDFEQKESQGDSGSTQSIEVSFWEGKRGKRILDIAKKIS